MAKNYLPDTNILIYALAQKPPYNTLLNSWLKKDALLLSVIVLAEFYSGYQNKEDLEKLEAIQSVSKSVIIDENIARLAGLYRKSYSDKGKKLALPDCLLAATAKDNSAILVTNNRKHFPMEDIKILEP